MVSMRLWGLTNQASETRAARLMAISALAPVQIGGIGFCTGFTGQLASIRLKCEPTIVTFSSVQSRLIASRFSSRRLPAPFIVVPKAWNSTSR